MILFMNTQADTINGFPLPGKAGAGYNIAGLVSFPGKKQSGDITVHSQKNKGTQVRIILPLEGNSQMR
jgi:hypothetical protein